jgi:hypothetical protein
MWGNVVKRHGKTVEIVQDGLQEWAAFELERDLIALYGRRDLGLGYLCNNTDGGEGASGHVVSEKTKQLKREQSLAMHADPEFKKRFSAIHRVVQNYPHVKAKRSSSSKAANARPEVKAKISASSKKMHADPEWSARRAEKLKLSWQNPASRDARIAAAASANSTPEARQRSSTHAKAMHACPEFRKLHAAAIASALARPEVKAKHVAAIEKMGKDPEVLRKRSESTRKTKEARGQTRPVACSNGMSFISTSSAARWLRENGYPKADCGNIVACCKGRYKHAHGYVWTYID